MCVDICAGRQSQRDTVMINVLTPYFLLVVAYSYVVKVEHSHAFHKIQNLVYLRMQFATLFLKYHTFINCEVTTNHNKNTSFKLLYFNEFKSTQFKLADK